MNQVMESIDINAHIANIQCEIGVESSTSSARLSFDNLGYGTITAVKFNAKGYNSFGDVVQISGKDTFFLIVQDVHIEKNTRVQNLKINLPNNDIRRLELQECQICYADGTVATYEGPDVREYSVDTFDNYGADGEALEALRDVISPEIRNLPKDIDGGWLCACGRYNHSDTNICTKCGLTKVDVFKITELDYVSSIKETHKKRVEEHQEKNRLALLEKAKKEKERNVLIAVGVIVVILLIAMISYMIEMSGRTTYSSEEEMQKTLQGTYTHYNDKGKVDRYLVIKGNTATLVYPTLNDKIDSTIDEWNYKKGTFSTYSEWLVTNEGDLKNKGEIYKRGGKVTTQSSSSNTYESGSTVLKITADRVTSNSSYTICTGSIKNIGKKTYKFVEVKGAFKDSSGNVVDTDWTYAVGSEGLEPGESSTFRLSVPKQLKISSCTVTLKDYD